MSEEAVLTRADVLAGIERDVARRGMTSAQAWRAYVAGGLDDPVPFLVWVHMLTEDDPAHPMNL